MARQFCLAAFGGIVGFAILCSDPSIEAQGKKEDPAKTIQKLQQQLKDRDQQIQKLETQLQKLKLEDVKDDAKITILQQRIKQLENELKGKKPDKADKTAAQWKKELDYANQSIKEKDLLIATLQKKAPAATADLSKEVERLRKSVKELEAIKKAPFVHSVILKLKKDDDAQVKAINDEATKTIAKISGVRGVWIGKPAENGTPDLAQKGYQLGLVILFDDANALQKFLEDPLHKQFNEKLADYWERPIVYDIQREEAMK